MPTQIARKDSRLEELEEDFEKLHKFLNADPSVKRKQSG